MRSGSLLAASHQRGEWMEEVNRILGAPYNGRVSREVQRAILEEQRQRWENTIVNAIQVNRVGEVLGDEAMKQAARRDIDRSLKALAEIDRMAPEING